jgi:phosphatidylserine/phosphatidylglycerophosphate/cardiolipin synthase-like enzyme
MTSRKIILYVLILILLASAFSNVGSTPGPQHLIIQPDDGRTPILEAIAGATDNIRLTIYEITDLQSVEQTPAAPADSIVQALINKAKSGVSVQVIVDQDKFSTGSSSAQIKQAVEALRTAGAVVHPSSSAFCVTHQKTFIIDSPTSTNPRLQGTAIILSLNLMPGYFGGTRDYGVITIDPDVVNEAARVFDSDFNLANPATACKYDYSAKTTNPPPAVSDTPSLRVVNLLWSPVNSKQKLSQLINSTKKSLVLTTEELVDADAVCEIQKVAQSPARPSVRILLSGDNGSNASAVKTLLGLGLPNLAIRVMPGQPSQPDAAAPQTPLYMHGKQVIVDGAQAFVGSENLTNTSLIQNRELGILFSDAGMIMKLQSVFESDFTTPGHSLPAQACTNGKECTVITCPQAP